MNADTPSTRSHRSSSEVTKDILFSLPKDEKDRMVNTIAHTSGLTGIKHQTKFIRYAITLLCEQLEQKHNNGQTFPAPAADPF